MAQKYYKIYSFILLIFSIKIHSVILCTSVPYVFNVTLYFIKSCRPVVMKVFFFNKTHTPPTSVGRPREMNFS